MGSRTSLWLQETEHRRLLPHCRSSGCVEVLHQYRGLRQPTDRWLTQTTKQAQTPLNRSATSQCLWSRMCIFPYHLLPCRVNKFTRTQQGLALPHGTAFPCRACIQQHPLKALIHKVTVYGSLTMPLLGAPGKWGVQFHMCREPAHNEHRGVCRSMSHSRECSGSGFTSHERARGAAQVSAQDTLIHINYCGFSYISHINKGVILLCYTFPCCTGILTWHTDSSYHRGTLHSVTTRKKAPLHSCKAPWTLSLSDTSHNYRQPWIPLCQGHSRCPQSEENPHQHLVTSSVLRTGA